MSRIAAVYAETSPRGLRSPYAIRAMHVDVFAMLVAALLAGPLQSWVAAQTQSNPGTWEASQSAAIPPAQAESGAFTFHVTTREVALEVIALDQHGGPVTDLGSTELRVSYSARDDDARGHHNETAAITSLQVVDPNAPPRADTDGEAGFQITASCLERSTLHYQVTFRPGPGGWTSGFHKVSLTTRRPGVRLFYRHRYFVGETVAPPKPPVTGPDSIRKLLMKDACYYPDTPLSLSLRAHLIDSGRSGVLRYQVAVDASSLSYLTLDASAGAHQLVSIDRRVQIDYGICEFNPAGRPIGFVEASLDQVLTSVDYARALAHGFHSIRSSSKCPIASTKSRSAPAISLAANNRGRPIPRLAAGQANRPQRGERPVIRPLQAVGDAAD